MPLACSIIMLRWMVNLWFCLLISVYHS